jgi:hypothetical protein
VTYGNTQTGSGTPREVSVNKRNRRGSGDDGTRALAKDSDGDSVLSDTYPNTTSANKLQRAPKSNPEGQDRRGYVRNDSQSTPGMRNTSAGRLRRVPGPSSVSGPRGIAMPAKSGRKTQAPTDPQED